MFAEADVADVSNPMLTMWCPTLRQQTRQVITDVAQARHQRRRPKRQRAGVVGPRRPRTEVERAGCSVPTLAIPEPACLSGVRLVPPPRSAPKLPEASPRPPRC